MTHTYQGKDHQPEHSMACTAAPGPCICANVTDTAKPAARATEEFRVDMATVQNIDVSKLFVQEPFVKNYLTVRNKQGVDVALFDGDYNLTGGNLHRKLMALESTAITRSHALTRLELEGRKDRSTILKLFILALGGWAFAAARGIWGF